MLVKRKHWLAFLIIIMVVTSCNFPGSTVQPPDPETPTTPIPGLTLPPPATPTPTPTPTPLPEVRIELGDTALLEGDTVRARQEYQTAAINTEDTELQAAALVGIARSYYQEGEFDQTIDTVKSLLNEHPPNQSLANGYYFLAEAHLARQEYTQAADAYAKYVEFNPGILDDLIQTRRAEALMSASLYPEAIQAFQAAIQASGNVDTGGLMIRIGQAYAAQDDLSNAIRTYLEVYETSVNDFIKAQANFLAGQAYLHLGFPEQAYARFQDSVNNFPRSYDSYSGLVILVNAGIPVNELNRGLTNYFAQQYGFAAEALLRYMRDNPDHDGTPRHYRALSLRASDDPMGAITEWRTLIQNHPGDRFYATAWQEISYTQWAFLEDFEAAADTLKNFVALLPNAPEAPGALFSAARILERSTRLTLAAQTWERLIEEYPASELSARGLFLAGITYYRLGDYPKALATFQRALVLATNAFDQTSALLWVGKTQQITGDQPAALESWRQATLIDPTTYYSLRAKELLENQPPLHIPQIFDTGVDLEFERIKAEEWLRTEFNLPPETDLSGLGDLTNNPTFLRAQSLWDIGLFQLGRGEFEVIREQIQQDVVASYRFMNHMLKIGAYRPAIFAARQVLTLAGMNNLQTLNAPKYFNFIRFGTYFKDLVLPEANQYGFHPLLIFSVIRQESFFESFVFSGAGARGLMQIMPATGQELATRYNYPPGYTTDDLLNPQVNVRLGVRYLANQRDYFGGDIYAALAAYNGGPGNTYYWKELAENDPDLFLEVIRFDETQNYIRYIAEFMNLYRTFYER
jgi:soluble lytic murein transglycosylase